MEVHISDLPKLLFPLTTRMALIEAISGVVHCPPLLKPGNPKPNFHVVVREVRIEYQCNSRRNPRHRAPTRLIGTVTFPTAGHGEAFLNAVRDRPLRICGSVVSFAQSLKVGRKILPHPELVRTLKTTPFKDSVQLITELKEHESLNYPLPISHLEFGRQSNHAGSAVFFSECELSTPWDACQLKFDLENDTIVIRWRTHENAAKSLVIKINTLLKIEAQNSSVLLSLESPPVFEIEMFPDNFVPQLQAFAQNEEPRRFRVAGFASGNVDALPYVNDQLRITFKTQTAFQEFGFQKRLFRLPDIIHRDRRVVKTEMYNLSIIGSIRILLKHLPIPVAFQLETLLNNGILDPLQILLVNNSLSALNESHGERALIKFIQLYDRSSHTGAHTQETQSGEGLDRLYLQILDYAINSSRDEIRPTGPGIATGDLFSCRALIITPTRLLLKGPSIEPSNSIIRKYQKSENFLRVSLRDEGGCALYATRDIDMTGLLETRYLRFLTEGLFVCGRKFEFLGYSNSSFRTQQCWFVCPFEMDGLLVNAATIRDQLGNFSKVIHNPSRYMARIGQAFTSTRQSVTLHPSQVLRMADVERNGHCFTDGVGTISQELADEVNDVLGVGLADHASHHVRPTCFQIRLGGFKGMLAIDPLLHGKVVRVRPSMEKFEAPNHPLALGIAGVSHKPLVAYLNRPLIKLLEDLGIQEHVFLNLQKQMIDKVEKSRTDLRLTANLMQQRSITGQGGMGLILNKLRDLLGVHSTFQSDFFNSCCDLMIMECLRGLKYHAHIPLEKSYSLYGVADEDNFLGANQIYACVQKTTQSPPIYLQGPIMISRAPCHHPGDVRVVVGVGKPDPRYAPRLLSLVNCVVFSVQGERPLPSCLGGGDLDGDHYILIGLPELIPDISRICKPAAYAPAKRMELDRECTIEDGAKFFLSHISNNNVGLISSRQLHIADHCNGGLLNEDCIRLAQLHSEAVDYPKNGVPVQLNRMPASSIKMKPDFMCAEHYTRREGYAFYESNRVLGKLFRQIPAERIDTLSQKLRGSCTEASEARSLGNERKQFGKIDPDGTISKALKKELGRVAIRFPLDDAFLKSKFNKMLDWFAEELMTVCWLNSLSSRRDHCLCEAEAFLGIFATRTSDKGLQETVEKQLEVQTSQLFEKLRSKILASEEKEEKAKKQKGKGNTVSLPEELVEYDLNEEESAFSLCTNFDNKKGERLGLLGERINIKESDVDDVGEERKKARNEYEVPQKERAARCGLGAREECKAAYDGQQSDYTQKRVEESKRGFRVRRNKKSDHHKEEEQVAAIQKGGEEKSTDSKQMTWEASLCQAYAAWVVSTEAEAGKFGANSFGMIALHVLMDTLDKNKAKLE